MAVAGNETIQRYNMDAIALLFKRNFLFSLALYKNGIACNVSFAFLSQKIKYGHLQTKMLNSQHNFSFDLLFAN